MGGNTSKVKEENPDKGSLPSEPISTPQKTRTMDLDPRSPSANIVRTPTEVLSAIKTKDADTSVTKIICLDPRSPTVEFTRTPILVETHAEGKKIHNKNLDNVRKQIVNLTPMRRDVKKSPKLLESSPISPKDIKKRNSVVGLLETNIDYIETDIDAVTRRISNNSLKAKFLGINLQSNEEQNAEIKDLNTKITHDEPNENSEVIENISSEIKVVEEETVKTKIAVGTEETKNNSSEALNENMQTQPPEQNEEILINNFKENESEMKKTLLDELDKKLTKLIYEDANLIESPKITKLKEGSRTPLGTKNGNENIKPKSAPKLKVHDKPTMKGNYSVSKIPVFKEKKGKGHAQCENTPPINRNFNGIRARKCHWDSDKTLII